MTVNNRHATLYNKLASILAPIAQRKGEVLYSAAEFLRPSKVYLLGYNPGQGGPDTTVEEHLKTSFERTDNAWLDEKWKDGRPSPLQNRMKKLFEWAGLDLRSTPSSNLIFAMSNDAQHADYRLAKVCWPAHQAILEIVQPSTLIVFGNGEDQSPFAFIRDMYRGDEKQPKHLYGAFSLKRLTTVIDGRHTTVIGLPHLSRYSPKLEHVKWTQIEC